MTSSQAADAEVRAAALSSALKTRHQAMGCQDALSSHITVVLQEHLRTGGVGSWTARRIPRGDLQATFVFTGFEEVEASSPKLPMVLTLQ